MQKIWNNLVDGIRRFCRENNFSDAALGLSGGLDSAITAVAAAEALGGDHVHALMMKTRYTSDLSLEIAAEIAELNGEIADLKSDLESSVDLMEIRRIAVEEYGMVEEEYLRMDYIALDSSDAVEIFEKEKDKSVGLSALLSAIGLKK